MQDAITAAITTSDLQGQYLDSGTLSKLEDYFITGQRRVKTAAIMREKAADIVKDAVAYSLSGADVTQPSGTMHTTSRYATCVRDLDFYLRYATYAMVAGDTSILDERVLNGLKETYRSLGVSVDATIQAVQAMKIVTAKIVGAEASAEMDVYFDYICDSLS
ncbi:MAG: allophycocyanin subunit beta [Thermosynechococcaceae cyanobacterium]